MQNKDCGALVLLAALFFCGAPICRGQSTPSPEGSQQAGASQKAKSGPLSLQDVLRFLDSFKRDIASEQEVIEKLARGVDFKADPETLAALREKGATVGIIAEIEKRAKREDPTSTLSLSCAPAECQIRINGQSAVATSDGQLVKSGLKLGDVTIDFEKDGYITEQRVVKVSGAEPGPPISVNLEPTDATKAANGKKLYGMMIAALGVTGNLKDLRSITAGGSMTSYKDGKPADWDFALAMGPPNLVQMKVTGSAGGIFFLCNGERCEEKKKGFLFLKGGKQLPRAVADQLEPNLRLFSRYHLVSFLQTLDSNAVRLTGRSVDTDSKTERHVHAEAPDSSYDLTVGPDLLPNLIEYNPRNGLGAVKVTYGEYVKVGGYYYPKHTSIGLPGSADSGIQVRLERVDLGSNLRASDFPK